MVTLLKYMRLLRTALPLRSADRTVFFDSAGRRALLTGQIMAQGAKPRIGSIAEIGLNA